MTSPRIRFDLLHYRQPEYLDAILEEARNFEPALVAFEVHDDGSPAEVRQQARGKLAAHPEIRAVFHPANRGVLAMLEERLEASKSDYTYIGAGDDATCPAAIQHVLRGLGDEDLPFIVSDYYSIHMESRTSVYVEAILPPEWMTGGTIPPDDLKKGLEKSDATTYIATHAALAPTLALQEAGGYPAEMKWHCDWFGFSVAAMRSGIRYAKAPLACWRQKPGGYSQSARSGAEPERDVLRTMLSTLEKPEYEDVRDSILCPNMTPMLDDIARQLLVAILWRPRYWKFLRPGHFKNAVYEIASPWITEERWGGKLVRWLERSPPAWPLQFLREPMIRGLLRLGGARIGRNVGFGRGMAIREPRGLRVGDNVTFGEGVYICAMHPLLIGSGTRVGSCARLESAASSDRPGVRFFRRKSVVIGENAVIGDGSAIGPGARIQPGQQVPPGARIDNVEKDPLFVLDSDDQIRVDHAVLREWYGLDPRGYPVDISEQRGQT